ncbi:hypothetical protein DMC30DRAFT_172972 [Rhodotorula diobovata]|uniref:Uncharacterized protein n=1 Tax=Rhodotorula diobovata TaxID=5288 RepID=A0A5C5FYY8_9BASI|nr:hypothetical protein DMC30DRAFT_172972 [Rhodotorula diobovata]
MRRFTYANPSPPPPTYAPYSYSFVLPCRSLGPRIMGLSRQILQGIKRDTGACEVQVLFREDGLCYVVATGSVGAIVRTLAAVRDLLFTHTKLTLAERDALAAAGTAWCEFNEHNLEAVDGYWLRDAYADRGGDGNRARVQRAHVETSEWRRGEVDWRRDDARSQPWPQERHPSTRYRTNYVERARARDDRRHNDSPRAGPSQPGPLRPSSRSRSPGRDSRHSSVPERPGRRPVDSPAPSYESRRVESRPSKHANKVSPHDFERQSARERTPTGQASNSELDVRAEEDEEERLEIPIPLTAIPLFLGPNASGHFIAQTTAVRLSVKADLEGATLWLERDSGKGGGDSLLEARLLVEKVLASHERAGGSPQAVRAPAREARAHDWNEVGATRSSTRRQDDSSPARKASQDDRKGGERAREVGDRRAGGPRRRSRSRSRSRGEDARDDRWKAKRDRGTDSDRRDSGWNEGTRGASEDCGWRREDATSASPVQRRRYRSRSRSPARDGGRGRA